MEIRTMKGGPGEPLRWRGHAPMHPDPAPAPAIPPNPEPPPIPPAKPAPAPAPAPAPPAKPAPVDDDPKALIAAMKAEREQLAADRAAFAEERKAFNAETAAAKAAREGDTAAKRRAFVRSMTLAVPLSDEHLDAVVPKEDPTTPTGQANLLKWRQEPKNAPLFTGVVNAPAFDMDKFCDEAAGGAEVAKTRTVFGAAWAKSMIETPATKEW